MPSAKDEARKAARKLAQLVSPGDPPQLTATVENLRRSDWEPTPLRPEQVLEGDPQPRSVMLGKSDDRGFVSFLWECAQGRYRWHFRSDEVVHILDGEVEIIEQGEGDEREHRRYTLRAGDVVMFPLGLRTEWRILKPLRRLSVHRSDVSLPERVRERLRRIKR